MKYRRHLSQDCDPGPPELEHPGSCPLCSSPRPTQTRGRKGSGCDFLPGPQMTCHLTLENPLNSQFCDAVTSCSRHLSPLSPGAVTGKPLSLHMPGADSRVTSRPRGDAPSAPPGQRLQEPPMPQPGNCTSRNRALRTVPSTDRALCAK